MNVGTINKIIHNCVCNGIQIKISPVYKVVPALDSPFGQLSKVVVWSKVPELQQVFWKHIRSQQNNKPTFSNCILSEAFLTCVSKSLKYCWNEITQLYERIMALHQAWLCVSEPVKHIKVYRLLLFFLILSSYLLFQYTYNQVTLIWKQVQWRHSSFCSCLSASIFICTGLNVKKERSNGAGRRTYNWQQCPIGTQNRWSWM